MIFITGDTHSDWMHRLNMASFPEQKDLTKEDYVIIAGDFGRWKDSKEEKYKLDWLESRNFTTLFIDGNHENFDILDSLEVEEWNGGNVHKVRPSVIHLMRGQVFILEEKKFFTFGGASSHDISDGILEIGDPLIKEWKHDYSKMFRVNHESWWERELPSEEEMIEGLKNLEKHEMTVDFVLTHSPYTSILRKLDGGSGFYNADRLSNYLQAIREQVDYKRWFMGHMHISKVYYEESAFFLYEEILRIL